jgi:hypothetical protein
MTPEGYGQILVGSTVDGTRANRRAHIIAWELATGAPVPPGMEVCHTCDTPACTRNDDEGFYVVAGKVLPRRGHLFLGTHADNMADMCAKGRKGSVARPLSCKNGHPRTPETLTHARDGTRLCRVCERETQRRYVARKRARQGGGNV